MSAEPVAEYVDANGNTWQLTAKQAKARGFKVVSPEVVEDKVIAPKRAANKSTRKK